MTFKEFLEITELYYDKNNNRSIYSSSLPKNTIGIKWSMGGTYGSCWDDIQRQVSGDIEPEFTEIDEVLEKLCPNITFLQYKLLMGKLLNVDETNEGDYYGGSIAYGMKYIRIRELYNYLKEKKFI